MLKNQYIVKMMNNFENLQLSCRQNLFSNTLFETSHNLYSAAQKCTQHLAVNPACNSQDLISNSPYCLPNNSPFASLENLVLDQLVIP